ncbi:MAG: ComF family protein [Spirochaetes bacterium]|nr:ComF family protein [Spirochaetota bacterium]
MLGIFLDILFPSRCAACGATVASADRRLCPSCAGRIDVLEEGCPFCSGPAGKSPCPSCADRHWYITRHIALSDYSGVMKSAIRKMKFGGIRGIYSALGSLAAREIVRRSISADIITWVPMNSKKEWRRGFNQSERISSFISKKTGIPGRALLREKRGAGAQRDLGLRDRFIHSLGRYEPVKGPNLSGKSVLLVDDVYTTGATINECARQLRMAGAEQVFSLTIARTDVKRLEKF